MRGFKKTLLATMVVGLALSGCSGEPNMPAVSAPDDGAARSAEMVDSQQPGIDLARQGDVVTIYATGPSAVQGALFGIEYHGSIEVTDWTVDGVRAGTIHSEDWPQSGSMFAVAWPSPQRADMHGSVKLVTLELRSGAVGEIHVTGVGSLLGSASLVTDRGDTAVGAKNLGQIALK